MKETLTSIGQAVTGEASSSKAAGAIGVSGVVIVAVASQLAPALHMQMANCVAYLCIAAALPCGLREFLGGQTHWSLRLCGAIGALALAWFTLFQTARGSAASWDAVQSNQSPPAPMQPAALFPVPSFLGQMLGYGSQFQPYYRPGGSTGWQVLVVTDRGQVWMDSVQQSGRVGF